MKLTQTYIKEHIIRPVVERIYDEMNEGRKPRGEARGAQGIYGTAKYLEKLAKREYETAVAQGADPAEIQKLKDTLDKRTIETATALNNWRKINPDWNAHMSAEEKWEKKRRDAAARGEDPSTIVKQNNKSTAKEKLEKLGVKKDKIDFDIYERNVDGSIKKFTPYLEANGLLLNKFIEKMEIYADDVDDYPEDYSPQKGEEWKRQLPADVAEQMDVNNPYDVLVISVLQQDIIDAAETRLKESAQKMMSYASKNNIDVESAVRELQELGDGMVAKVNAYTPDVGQELVSEFPELAKYVDINNHFDVYILSYVADILRTKRKVQDAVHSSMEREREKINAKTVTSKQTEAERERAEQLRQHALERDAQLSRVYKNN